MARRFSFLMLAAIAIAASCGGRNLDVGAAGADSSCGGDCPCEGGGGSGGNAGSGGLPIGGSGGAVGGSGGQGGGGGIINPLDCIGCIATNCPDVLSCITNPTCIQGIGCAFTQCLSGGQPDLLCVADCFGGDIDAALEALTVITCIGGQCGDSCGSIIPLPF